MDSSSSSADVAAQTVAAKRKKRQLRSATEKLRIIEAASVPGAWVALVARAHGVNANQVFAWRKLHLAGRLTEEIKECHPNLRSFAARNSQRRRTATGSSCGRCC